MKANWHLIVDDRGTEERDEDDTRYPVGRGIMDEKFTYKKYAPNSCSQLYRIRKMVPIFT